MKKREAVYGSVGSPDLERLSGEELSRFVSQLFEERGRKAFEMAKAAILEEANKLECKTTREALRFFANYWTDTTRPALLSIACEALGGDPEATMPFAVPLMLVCGAIDIHDDIIDRSKTKENHLTIYGKFGKEVALLIGDALLFKGLVLLSEGKQNCNAERLGKVMHVVKDLFFELGDSQVLETSLKGRRDLKPKEYLSMVRKKAADFEAYMRVSAILANGSEEETEALAHYGRALGILTILGDDNTDMFDASELLNRMKHEVLPLPMLYALQQPDLKTKLLVKMQKRNIGKRDAERMCDLIYEAGTFDKTEHDIYEFIAIGQEALKNLKDGSLLSIILKSTYPK